MDSLSQSWIKKVEVTGADILNLLSHSATREDIQALSDKTDLRFKCVDERFEQMNQRFDNVERRLDRSEARFDGFEQRIEKKLSMLFATLVGCFGLPLLTGLILCAVKYFMS